MLRAHWAVSLAVGLILGFVPTYWWIGKKAPGIVSTIPPVFRQRSAIPSAPPPLDRERVSRLQQAARENPKDIEPAKELGNLYFDQRDYDKAADWYTRALVIQPRNPDIRTDLGTAFYNNNRVDEAIAEYRKALEIDSTHAQALFTLGLALKEGKNDVVGAIQQWERLLKAYPNFPQRAAVERELNVLKGQKK